MVRRAPGTPHDTRLPRLPARFSLEEQVGAGAFGDVWSAFDDERQERVALKLLRPEHTSSLGHFKREFRQLADVVHPNLVTLYELFAHDELWFFTMEFVDGVDFLQFVRPKPSPDAAAPEPVLDVARLEAAFAQLVCGVAALHDRGMVHRDLKPSNVRVTPEGRVVVLDFGLVTDSPETGALPGYLVGAPAYLAPELASGARASAASDWYAVGTILFECLTGRLPFEGTSRAVLRAKRETEAPSPGVFAPHVPQHLTDECRALLQRDPAARGRPRSLVPQGPSDVGRAPFVGRKPELASLWAAFDETAHGTGVTVFVEAPSGTGKSALLRHFLGEVAARHPDALLLSGRCREHEAVPYQAVDGAMDALARALVRLPSNEVAALRDSLDGAALMPLFPVLGEALGSPDEARRLVGAPERRRRAFTALRRLFSELTHRRRVVLAIDDLQWGDFDGATLLGELTTGPEAPPMLVVASFRSGAEADSACLCRLLDIYTAARKEVRRTVLAPLPADDALALARVLRPEASAEDWYGLLEESRCHPFLLTELARARGANTKVSMATLFDARLQALAADERHLLEVLAVAARPPTHDLLVKATSGAGTAIQSSPLRVLRRLRAERLVSSDATGDRIDLYHDRVREAVAARMSPERLRDCHRAFAHALEARPEPDHELLVHHWRDAGEPGQAARHASAAGERADAALAFAQAANFYGLALALTPLDARDARPLHERRGQALWNAGEGRQAAEAFLAAAEGAEGLDQLELKRRAAESLLYVGAREPGVALLHEVLRGVGLRVPGSGARVLLDAGVQLGRLALRGLHFRDVWRSDEVRRKARLQIDTCYTAAQALGWSDPTLGPSFILRGVRIALDSGDAGRAARFLSEYAVILSILKGDRAAAEPIFARAFALAEQCGDNSVLGKVTYNLGMVDLNLGHFRESVATLGRAIALMRVKCVGVDWDIYNGEFLRMGAMHLAGDADGLLREYPRVCQEVDARGNLHAAINIRVCTGFRVELIRGRPEEALRVLDQAVRLAGGTLNPIQDQLRTVAMVDILLHLGRHRDAAAYIDSRWAALQRSPVMRVPLQRQMLLDARARAHGLPGTFGQ